MLNKPYPISLCMIVKNEKRTLPRCLQAVKDIVREIIVVDTGSTDKTKEIALKYTDKIYDFTWIDDFAAARNYSFSRATQKYILWLDADDILFAKDQARLRQTLASLSSDTNAVSMYYNLIIDGNGRPVYRLRRNRIVRRDCNFQWIGAIHEYLAVSGKITDSDAAITHHPLEHDANRNLRIYEQRQTRGEPFSPRDLFYFANELLDHQLYNRAIEYYQRFLATGQGWIEDNINACGKLADCFYNLNDAENQLRYILKSFEYDSPRADFCCRLGYSCMQRNQLRQAVFWYKTATQLELPDNSWGMFNSACWTWVPHLQLCVCYSRLGNDELASQHNELAAQYIPNDPKIAYNREYFHKVLATSQEKIK